MDAVTRVSCVHRAFVRSTTDVRASGGTIVDGALARRPVAEVCEADAPTRREEATSRDRARRDDACAVGVYPKDR